jgi:ABC-type Fe3+-hydroxamate transport system substrate-binding protein
MTGGNGHSTLLFFSKAPDRVVSLVPSMTESLFELGLGDHLVGVTDFCTPPSHALGRMKRVGGTLTPDVDRILSLQPELVLANQEENPRSAVEALEREGIKVWVTFPRSAAEAISVLWAIVGLFRANHARPVLEALEISLDWAGRASTDQRNTRVFCPIWSGESPLAGPWWMTANGQTYLSDVLAICGGENVFARRDRRFPEAADLGMERSEPAGDRDIRYPRVLPADVVEARPEVILLPSEPYAFSATHIAQMKDLLADTPAIQTGRIYSVDGSLLTWHGTRLGRALAELPSLLASESPTTDPAHSSPSTAP